jgi:hypothetical protein
MSLENCPMLNCREELKDVPLVFWPKEALENKEHDEINEILEKREEEFNKLLTELIMEQMPEIGKFKKGDYLCFHESYRISKKDKENNIFFCCTVDKYNEKNDNVDGGGYVEITETSDLVDFIENNKELVNKIALDSYKGDFDKLKPLNLTSKDSDKLEDLFSELSFISNAFEFNFQGSQDKTLSVEERKIKKIAMLNSIESIQSIWADIYKLLNKK